MTTFTHPTRGDAEYTVTIYCDDPSHNERTIDIVGYWSKPPGTIGFLSWLAARDSLQTPFGEKRRLAALGVENPDTPGGVPNGMDYATRWRFECLDCRTLPVRGDVMESMLDQLRKDGRVSRISLRAISARLTT